MKSPPATNDTLPSISKIHQHGFEEVPINVRSNLVNNISKLAVQVTKYMAHHTWVLIPSSWTEQNVGLLSQSITNGVPLYPAFNFASELDSPKRSAQI